MIYLLGLLDILSGISLVLLRFQLLESIAWFFVVYLTIKGLMFLPDISSFLDLFASLFILLAILGYYPLVSWLFVIWLLQKGFVSFS